MAESGTWDQESRIDMLLIRFWCKELSLEPSSTTYRAMCLSVQSMTKEQREQPTQIYRNIDQIHRQPWAQQLWAAAQRFGMAPLDPTRLWHALVLVQAQNHLGAFEDMPYCLDTAEAAMIDGAPPDNARLRLVLPGTDPNTYREGVNCWQVDEGETLATVFQKWSTPVRAACFAALKKRGNVRRQEVLRTKVMAILNDPDHEHGLRRWSSITSASYLQPYWHIPNVAAARRMVQVRLDCAPTEDYMRRRTLTTNGKKAERLDDRVTRACYCCGPIMGIEGIYHPETLEHVLLHCTRPEAVTRRDAFRNHLSMLMDHADFVALEGGAVRPQVNTGDGTTHDAADTAFLTVLRLCLGQGMAPPQPGVGTMARVASLRTTTNPAVLAQRARSLRALPELVHDADAALTATRWMQALFGGWMDSIRSFDAGACPASTPGCRLATCVAEHIQQVFRDRRVFLKENSDYKSRTRDPSGNNAADRILNRED